MSGFWQGACRRGVFESKAMTVIEFQCPSCSHPLSASEDKIGAEARCPGCGTSVLIPGGQSIPVVTSAGVNLTQEDRNWGMLCHLSPFIAVWAGGMGFLGPLICWVAKKDSSPWVDYHGKEALNFQINMFGYLILAVILGFCTFFVSVMIFGVYAVVMPIIAAVQANDGKRYAYPGIVRIIT
jgi:uncharacterized Tic20 family protein